MSGERIDDHEVPDWAWLEDFLTEDQVEKMLRPTQWMVLLRESRLKPTERLVGFVLFSHIMGRSAGAETTVGQQTIARESGLDVRTVRRVLTKLEEQGWVERDRFSRRQATRTFLCWPEYGHMARTETGQRAPTQEPECGHLCTSADTGAPECGHQCAESGHSALQRYVEGTDEGEMKKAVDAVDRDACTICHGSGFVTEGKAELPCILCAPKVAARA